MSAIERLRNLPLSTRAYRYDLDIWVKKAAENMATVSGVSGIYLALGGRDYLALPFFLSAGLWWTAVDYLNRTQKPVDL